MTSAVVEGRCTKRRQTQVFGFEPDATDVEDGDETRPWIRLRCIDKGSISSGSRTVGSVTEVIFVDGSGS